MDTDANIMRLLGGAQLMVFVLSLLNDRLLTTSVGEAHGSEILINISDHLVRFRLSSFFALLTSFCIIVLGCLFYAVFREQYRVLALIALGCFLAEAITLAVSKLGAYALVPLSREFVAGGAQPSSAISSIADMLYYGIDRRGYDLHMFFFCLGGALWYYLLLVSRIVPTALAVWGLVAVVLLAIPVMMILYDRDLKTLLFLGIAYAPYELVLGVWLLLTGLN